MSEGQNPGTSCYLVYKTFGILGGELVRKKHQPYIKYYLGTQCNSGYWMGAKMGLHQHGGGTFDLVV
jgi:hypothetical protein